MSDQTNFKTREISLQPRHTLQGVAFWRKRRGERPRQDPGPDLRRHRPFMTLSPYPSGAVSSPGSWNAVPPREVPAAAIASR